MVRKMSKKAKAEAYDAMAEEASRYRLALHDFLNDKIRWSQFRSLGEGESVRIGISRWTTCPLIHRQQLVGSRVDFSVHSEEEIETSWGTERTTDYLRTMGDCYDFVRAEINRDLGRWR